MAEKYFVSWTQVKSFVEKVSSLFPAISGVYGIPRGGLCLATMISYKTNTPLLLAPCPGCLIVDDICDSGESLLHYIRNSSNPSNDNNYYTATMFYRDNKLGIIPDYYVHTKEGKWIVFPWEMEE